MLKSSHMLFATASYHLVQNPKKKAFGAVFPSLLPSVYQLEMLLNILDENNNDCALLMIRRADDLNIFKFIFENKLISSQLEFV